MVRPQKVLYLREQFGFYSKYNKKSLSNLSDLYDLSLKMSLQFMCTKRILRDPKQKAGGQSGN